MSVELETVANQREWFGKHVATVKARDAGQSDRAIFGQIRGAGQGLVQRHVQ